MPTRTIYFSAADLPLLDRAAELGGGVSAAVIAALRHYIQLREVEMLGYEQIEVTVSDGEVKSRKRFTGRRLARVMLPASDEGKTTRVLVYLTQRGQYAVHSRSGADWAASGDESWWENRATWSPDWYQDRSRLDVYPDLEAMTANVAPPVAEAVRRSLDTAPLEDLDI